MWRQLQTGVGSGGIDVWVGAQFTGNDQQGQSILADTTMNTWHLRNVDLSSFAGRTILNLNLGNYLGGPAGTWDIYFGDIAIVHANGSVTSIYNRQALGTLSTFSAAAESGVTAVAEQVADTDPRATTDYYLDDHLGTTQVELADGGWPLWQGQFTPFGAELPDGSTTMHYKFTGKERDAESGLDDFGARYYSSNIGRFMSPDKPFADQHPSIPQSWNLYSYVRNNPLRAIDPTGEAVRFLGDEAARNAELQAEKAGLVGSPVADRLYINQEIVNGKATGNYFLGINGDHDDFANAGSLEKTLQYIVDDPRITDFTLTNTLEERTPNFPFGDRNQTVNISDPLFGDGGATTTTAGAMQSGVPTIAIDPNGLRDLGDPNKPTLGEAVAHENGHREAHMKGHPGNFSNRHAVDAENEARRRGGKSRGKRHDHSGGFPQN
jgi:RHS repeat-associated protein